MKNKHVLLLLVLGFLGLAVVGCGRDPDGEINGQNLSMSSVR
jgi:hypothetical protein